MYELWQTHYFTVYSCNLIFFTVNYDDMDTNEKTYSFSDLKQQSGLTPRNLRYYLYELELRAKDDEDRNSRHYTKSVRDKIVFVGKLREQAKEHNIRLKLPGIREILEDAADWIGAVADGREPLEIFNSSASDLDGIKHKISSAKTRGEDVLNINMNHVEAVGPVGTAKDYIQKHMEEFSQANPSRDPAKRPRTTGRWQRVQLGENVELRVRGKYSQKILGQLALLGQFVDSILKEDDNNG